ncbi:tail protein X [Sphingomonas sp.]|uniref:tail protein X n=1 Tax=Sphingomonas sp. TaxID=28214 RepID=UPI0028A775D1|nr:tail protein X [Sphingomonas sp.]
MADLLTARQGDTLDELLWRERSLGPEALDAVLAANPGLADRGPTLPIGTPVTLPLIAAQALPVRETVQLWS